MNREQKKELVIKLYQEGKTMREISKEAHMSFGDIGKITKELNQEDGSIVEEKSKESRALELFKKRKHPVDVSIIMDLNPSEVLQIYKQFLELNGFYNLIDLYKMVKADTSLLKRVHDVMKRYDFGKKDLINFVNWAGKFDFLKEEVNELERQFDHLMKQRHIANDSLSSTKKKLAELAGQIETYNNIIKQKLARIENMENEIRNFENQISQLSRSNDLHDKTEQTGNQLEILGHDVIQDDSNGAFLPISSS